MLKMIKGLAGWQKLWLAASLVMLAAGVAWLPGILERPALAQLAEARARVIADFEKPECLPVRSTPYTQLAPVPAGAPCHAWSPMVLTRVLSPSAIRRFLQSQASAGLVLMGTAALERSRALLKTAVLR